MPKDAIHSPEPDKVPGTPVTDTGSETDEKRSKVPPSLRPYCIKKGEVRNPWGAPKKGLGGLNAELRALGYAPLTRQLVEEHYLTMLALPIEQLKALAEDAAKPMIARILAKSILSGKGFDIIERMLDRAIGKPSQRNEVTGADGGPLKVEGGEVGDALASVLADFNARNA
jgi:hypothetical protein